MPEQVPVDIRDPVKMFIYWLGHFWTGRRWESSPRWSHFDAAIVLGGGGQPIKEREAYIAISTKLIFKDLSITCRLPGVRANWNGQVQRISQLRGGGGHENGCPLISRGAWTFCDFGRGTGIVAYMLKYNGAIVDYAWGTVKLKWTGANITVEGGGGIKMVAP